MTSPLLALLRRDLGLAFANRGELLTPLLFYLLVAALFPLSLAPTPATLALIAPGIVWVAALLATLLSLDRLFRSDFDDGSLEMMVLSPVPLGLLVLAKTFAHWLVTGLPLVLVSPLLGMMMGLDGEALATLPLALLLGTPVLSLIGAVGAALTLGLRQAGALLALLVLPLYIPTLIFGANAVAASMEGLESNGQLMIVAALLCLSVSLAPFAAAGALRVSLD